MGRVRRLTVSVVLVAVVVAAASCSKPGHPLLTLAQETTTSVSTTSTTELTPTTLVLTSTSVRPGTTTTRRRTTTSVKAPATTATTLHRLVINEVVVGLGTPCETADPSDPANGCFFFVQVPDTQQHVVTRLKSDRGYDNPLTFGPNACKDGATRPQDTHSCEAYIGPVHGRTAGETECFWLTSSDPAYESRSNDQCTVWTPRQ